MTLNSPEPAAQTPPPHPAYPGDLADHTASDSAPSVTGRAPEFQSLRVPGIVALVFAGALTVIEVVEAVLAWPVQSTLLDLADGGDPGTGVLTAFDALVLPWYAVGLGAFISTGIWSHRAHRQAGRARPWVPRRRASGWAWAGWIMPVVSFWFPLQVVRDASLDPDRAGQRPTVRSWWWAAWIGFLISSWFANRVLTGQNPGESSFQVIGTLETINALMAVAALVLWISVVRTVTRDHEAVFQSPTPAT